MKQSNFNSVYRYLTSTDGSVTYGDHIGTKIVGSCLSIIVVVLLYYFIRKSQAGTRSNENPNRFRKRDKVLYYGKRFLRTMQLYSSTARDEMRSEARRFHEHKSPSHLVFSLPRKPPEFQPDIDDDYMNVSDQDNIPPEILYLLKSVKVFGHFEQPVFLELCKSLESKIVLAGAYLFRIGDADDSLYVVQKGLLHVFITDERDYRHVIKVCVEGDTVFSLLSMVDVMTGHNNPYKTVSCKAMEDSVVLKLPAVAFLNVFKQHPERMVRIIQMLMIRLQRVTFLALHDYLGLTTELTRTSEPTSPAPMTGRSQNNDHAHLRHPNTSTEPSPHLSTSPFTASSLDQTQSTTMPDINETSSGNQLEHNKALPIIDRVASLPIPQQKDSALSSVHRSISVADSRQLKPDLEEAAVRARVENSRDTTFFLKHKISYPNVSNKRALISSIAQQRSSFSEPEYARFYSKSTGSVNDDVRSEDNEHGDDSDLQSEWPQIRQTLAKALGFEGDITILDDKVTLRHLPDKYTLAREGEQLTKLFFIIKGSIEGYMSEISGAKRARMMFTNRVNEISGLVSVLTGEPTLFSYRTNGLTDVCILTQKSFYDLMLIQPDLALPIAAMMVQRMSPLVRQIDFALEWMLVEAGKALYRQDYRPQNVYIVLNGRVRSISLAEDKKRRELIGEHGRGEMVGLTEVLMDMPRQSTTIAVRDTELAVIPSGLLNYIKWRHPSVVSQLIHVLSQKIYGTMHSTLTNSVSLTMPLADDEFQDKTSTANKNLSTVAIVAASDDVPLDSFTCELVHSLSAIGPTLRLTKQIIIDRFGDSVFESINDYRLSAWLGQQEELHRIVVYQCDKQLTPWSKRSLRQADCILIVGIGWREPVKGSVENEIERIAVRAQKVLILLHRMGSLKPKGTVHWLKDRNWCTFHHHIRCPERVFLNMNIENLSAYTNLFEPNENPMTDFARMARFITGTAIGLVLGGGGARGCAHAGVIQAMHEAGIPIDLIGGTSMGAFMGALYADELNIEGYIERGRKWSNIMTSFWKKVFDLTYPVTSMFTGAAFNETIEKTFHDVQIEDLWIPYFCISTDISASKMRVHTSGSVWRYVRASMTYSFYIPPMCDPRDGHLLVDGCYMNNLPGSLWRYVRASMSLSGYFPPLCDPNDGHLLLDGGYVNNLPADVMYKLGAHTVIAVDVGAQDEQNFYNFGDQLSGWWILYKRWTNWSNPIKIPELSEIQTRLAYVSGQRQLEIVKNSNYCEYLRPPIDRYQTIQFGLFDEIREVGYHHGKGVFYSWSKLETYDSVFLKQKLSGTREKPPRLCKQESAATKFIDLAELITRVREPCKGEEDDDEDEDDDGGDEIARTNNRAYATNRWFWNVSRGVERFRRRVRIRSRPDTPPVNIDEDSHGISTTTNSTGEN